MLIRILNQSLILRPAISQTVSLYLGKWKDNADYQNQNLTIKDYDHNCYLLSFPQFYLNTFMHMLKVYNVNSAATLWLGN